MGREEARRGPWPVLVAAAGPDFGAADVIAWLLPPASAPYPS